MASIHRGHSDNSRVGGRIQRCGCGAIITHGRDDEVSSSFDAANDCFQYSIRGAEQTHVDHGNLLAGQPGKGVRYGIGGAAGG
jgi:hypothetical protein